MKLQDMGVVLREDEHRYFLDGKELMGITGMLSRQLFPGKYDDVDEETLKKASEYGKQVHKWCELYDTDGYRSNQQEVVEYSALCFTHDLYHEASEYIVTDGYFFASPIDKVFRCSDDEIELSDIKTTAELDRDYVRWQLSIYAYLFERQNPGAKATRLTAIWLRGDKSDYVQVERVPDDVVAELLQCEREGREFERKELAFASSALALPQNFTAQLKELHMQYEAYKAQLEAFKAQLLEQMQEHHVKTLDCEAFRATVVPESSSLTFDAKRFEAEEPELFERFKTKKQVRKSILKLTIRN
jgi:hypothetical protein